jgi:hypothetical protein
MGRGGADLLWSSGFERCAAARRGDAANLGGVKPKSMLLMGCDVYRLLAAQLCCFGASLFTWRLPRRFTARRAPCLRGGARRGAARQTGYRIKPYGQLVSVSLTHYCACTPDLSTSWSRTTLQGDRSPRGYLISRRVSRLDAFSGYLFRT